eukprot:CAMPEP_0114587088 /NCGR_PEP_ID=MMETSP0125-20121206/10138_1 /TAXON_ID=485358 ORGANISM="Aristerostoma sp., Strain ATCC 50986" /NCGR_SAMPLE_ID=MMETSP0125 /ASSEMBLY_ACC=CAM_ASM_000245 /LENGTH=135 /DNA_ID=CAMNT_0001782829 /DNA_START=64 /DNA_END=471 /DNA_ORIENTATION=+
MNDQSNDQQGQPQTNQQQELDAKAHEFPIESDSFVKEKDSSSLQLTKKAYSTLEEPETHRKNKTFFEKFFMTCFAEKNQLSPEELILFNNIKTEANTTFDTKDSKYDDHFKEIWNNLATEKRFEIPHDEWKNFGF